MSQIVLQTRRLTTECKGFTVVREVDLKVRRGTIRALIAPKGAGRTTSFKPRGIVFPHLAVLAFRRGIMGLRLRGR